MEKVLITQFKSLVEGSRKDYYNRYAPSRALKAGEIIKASFEVKEDGKIIISYDENGVFEPCGHLSLDISESEIKEIERKSTEYIIEKQCDLFGTTIAEYLKKNIYVTTDEDTKKKINEEFESFLDNLSERIRFETNIIVENEKNKSIAVLYPNYLTSNKVKELLDDYKEHTIEANLTAIITEPNIAFAYEITFSVY